MSGQEGPSTATTPRQAGGGGGGDDDDDGNEEEEAGDYSPTGTSKEGDVVGRAASIGSAAATAAATAAAAADKDDKDDKDDKKGSVVPASSSPSGSPLLCHETIEPFDDPALFRRLVEPSVSSAASGVATSADKKRKLPGTAAPTQPHMHPYPPPHGYYYPPPPHPAGHRPNYEPQQPKPPRGGDRGNDAAEGTNDSEPVQPPPPPPPPAKRPSLKSAPPAASSGAQHPPPWHGTPHHPPQIPPPYMHSWQSLELGLMRGSAAWNRILIRALQEQSGGHWHDAVPQLTPQEVLDVIRCRCHLRTVCPPTQQNSTGNGAVVRPVPPASLNRDPDGTRSGLVIREGAGGVGDVAIREERRDMIKTLSELYGTMIAQDAIAGHERYVDVTSEQVLKKMRHVENEHSRLQLRQDRILELSKQVGLLTRETRIEALRMRGIIVSDYNGDEDARDADNGGSRKRTQEEGASIPKKPAFSMRIRGTAYWRHDFDNLLEERRSEDAGTFLFAHDAY